MGIFAAGIEGMGILGDVACRKATEVLPAEQAVLDHADGITIEMDVVAHLIEGYMEGVVRIGAVEDSVPEDEDLSLDAQGTYVLLIDPRGGLGTDGRREP